MGARSDGFMFTWGFSLIVMVVAVFCLVLTLGPFNAEKIEKSARSFAILLGEPEGQITCLGMFTTENGYVSCTIAPKDVKKNPISIECSAALISSGCRLSKARMYIQ